jgi:SAM-dependent methyltransferase
MTDESGDTLYSNDAYFYDLDNREQLKYDISFYVDRASKINGHILELACGTGRITIPLAQAGHEVWGLEFSRQMLEQFKNKIKDLPVETADRIHLFHGDMSDFTFDRKFPLIIIPGRSFQLLLDESKENACLGNVYTHLDENGYFIFDIANYIKNIGDNWAGEEENFDWENIDPRTGYKVRRTHIKKKIDLKKQIIYPKKIYRVLTEANGQEKIVEEIVRQSAWKYFSENQIKNRLISNGFKIVEEMGYFDGKPINEGSEFIFVCRKNRLK